MIARAVCPVCGPLPVRWRGRCIICHRPARLLKRQPAEQTHTCVDCGKPCNRRAERCRSCGNKHRIYWTRERVILAIQWHYLHTGEIPKKNDWLRARPENPTFQLVVKRFGNWGNAIEAAGYPRPRGRPRLRRPRRSGAFFERERSSVYPIQKPPRMGR